MITYITAESYNLDLEGSENFWDRQIQLLKLQRKQKLQFAEIVARKQNGAMKRP